MPRGSISRRTSDGTTGAAALEIIGSPVRGTLVKEVSVYLAAATASNYGLGRPAAKGITPTTPVSFLADGGIDSTAFKGSTAIAWGTGPTLPAQFFRRVGFPAVITSFVSWVFEKGLFIPAGGTLVLWNLAANGVVDVTVVVDE